MFPEDINIKLYDGYFWTYGRICCKRFLKILLQKEKLVIPRCLQLFNRNLPCFGLDVFNVVWCIFVECEKGLRLCHMQTCMTVCSRLFCTWERVNHTFHDTDISWHLGRNLCETVQKRKKLLNTQKFSSNVINIILTSLQML